MTVRLIGSDQGPAATAASGINSHAEGANTTASGNYAHAEGSAAQASGASSHAEGASTKATGAYAHAEGSNTTAAANLSHAGGNYATADVMGAWTRSAVQPSAPFPNGTRAQVGIYNMAVYTASTTSTMLTTDGSGTAVTTGAAANVLVIPLYANFLVQMSISVRRPGVATSSQGWLFSCLLGRDSGSARLVGAATQLATWSDATIGTINITAGTNYLAVFVTAATAAPATWHCLMQVNEMASSL